MARVRYRMASRWRPRRWLDWWAAVWPLPLLVAGGLTWMPPGGGAAGPETASFELTAEITWSARTAPLDFPDRAHMSGLVGATHNARYVLFRDGHAASSGLELVAENGRAAILRAEFTEAMRRGRLGGLVEGPSLAQVPGRLSTRFEADRDHPLLSFVTMLAPSPDWFTGAADIALMAGGEWIDEMETTLWVWDAGTDSGRTYGAPNQDTQPRQSVRLLASRHFLTPAGLTSVGTLKLRRLRR